MLRVLILFLIAITPAAAAETLAGTWACQSMNAGAYTGRPCRLEPWLKLNADKTYEWGREKGRWELRNDTLSLSERAGKGRRNEDGKLVFEYDLRGSHYTLILYRRAD